MPDNRRKPADLRQNRITHDLGVVVSREPAALIPSPPSGLLKSTRERWDAFWRSDVSQAIDPGSDRGRLDRWIRWVDEWERAYRSMRKDGRVVEGSQGQPRLSPLASYLSTCEAAIQAAEKELGLTPKARADLGIAFVEAKRSIKELNAALDAAEDDPDEYVEVSGGLVGDGSRIEAGA